MPDKPFVLKCHGVAGLAVTISHHSSRPAAMRARMKYRKENGYPRVWIARSGGPAGEIMARALHPGSKEKSAIAQIAFDAKRGTK